MIDEQFIAADIAAYPADRGRVLVSNRETGRPHILPEQLFAILRRADGFDSFAGHVRKLAAAGWQDDGSGFIESAFQDLIARGLLVPKSAFRATLLEKPEEGDALPPLTSVAITTRDRYMSFRQCLASCIEKNDTFDRRPSYIVLDDSRQSESGAKLKEILTQLAAGGARISYAGMEEKSRFADELVRAAKGDGLPAEVVSFALFGDVGFDRTLGANRNALLLAVPGELSLMMDDDTLCQTAVLAESPKILALSSMTDPTDCRFYDDRRQLTHSVRPTDVDILSCHEKLLGRSISGCLSALGRGSALDMDRVTPASVHSFGRPSGVVRASVSGYWGDSGIASPHLVLELTGESRELLMRSKEHYARAKESREVFRGVSRYTISDSTMFIPMNAGLDNRSLLPPFFPVGRNSDGIFAMTLRLCAEDAFIGHIPLAVLHSPQERRGYAQDSIEFAPPRLAEIVPAILGTFSPPPRPATMSGRLSRLGELLVDIGSLKIEEFREHVESVWAGSASRYIGHLEYLLDLHHGTPGFWAEDVRAFIDNLMDFTVHKSAAVPRELLEKQTPAQAIETCRRIVRRFGELLRWWPVIDGAARQLRETGTRLARHM